MEKENRGGDGLGDLAGGKIVSMEQENRGDDSLDAELVSLLVSELQGGKIDAMETDSTSD